MLKREDLIKIGDPLHSLTGIELGVAEGTFSYRVLSTCNIKHWYGVDMWAGDRGHDVIQYKSAIKRLQPFRENSSLLKMKFSEAVDLFPNEYFDVVYIDGYAHTGQDSGQILDDWWPKVKKGGLFSGDDYSMKWPLNVAVVNGFFEKHNLELNIFEFDNSERDPWSLSPSWYTIK